MARTRLAEHVDPGRRLGRHVNHDPRSLRYMVAADGTDVDVEWPLHIAPLNQLNRPSCTGNAQTHELGMSPNWATIQAVLTAKGWTLDEAFAVAVYEWATRIDPFPGQCPEEDTGSDGLSVNKVAVLMGLASGYVHGDGLEAAKTMIQNGPIKAGTIWTTALDHPDSNGYIAKPASGSVRGGHEYVYFKRDAARGLWWIRNSWDPARWGIAGTAFVDDDGFAALQAEEGDLTQSRPLTEPAPVPTPEPEPGMSVWDVRHEFETRAWREARHAGSNKAAAESTRNWAAGKLLSG